MWVEHLVLAPPDDSGEVSRHVDVPHTQFAAEEQAASVADRLRAIDAALAASPVERLEAELRVLAIEGGAGVRGGGDAS